MYCREINIYSRQVSLAVFQLWQPKTDYSLNPEFKRMKVELAYEVCDGRPYVQV